MSDINMSSEQDERNSDPKMDEVAENDETTVTNTDYDVNKVAEMNELAIADKKGINELAETDEQADNDYVKCPNMDEAEDDDDKCSSKHSVPSPTDSCSSKDSQNDNLDTSDSNVRNEHTGKRPMKNYTWHKRQASSDDSKKAGGGNVGDKHNFYLKISNFPTSWSFGQIKDFILKEYGPVNNIYMAADKDMCFVGMVKLEFVNFTACRKAWDKFHGKVVEELTLFADTGDSDDDDFKNEIDSFSSPPKKKKRSPEGLWRPDIDVWEVDPKGLYGFKPDFLKALDITPPIDKWVQVSNFRCDKSELKEVMELAGDVLICKVTYPSRGQKVGKVMYSHPIEAVQAVSMLNNQEYYGQVLKVTIDRQPIGTVFLPKGLQAVGPGLGMAGKALRDVVKQYERFVKYKSSFVNPTIFRNPDLLFSSNDDVSKIYIPKRLDELHSSAMNYQNNYISQLNSTQNPTAPSSMSNFGSNQSLSGPIPSGSTTGPTGSKSGPNGSIPGPVGSMPRPGTGPVTRPNAPFSNPMSMRGPMPGPSGPMSGPGPSGPMSGPGPSGPMSAPGPLGVMPCPPGIAGPNRPMTSPRSMPGPIGPMTNPTGPMVGPIGPPSTTGPMGHSNAPMLGPPAGFNGGPNAMPQSQMPAPPQPKISRPQNNPSSVVELSNLPLTTTFPLLCEKMAQCGQVMSLQLTSPGCAVVQFAQVAHAERCFQQYNNCIVLGNRIVVQFI